mgnify:CR=1 FL=1
MAVQAALSKDYHADRGIMFRRLALVVGALVVVPVLLAIMGEPIDGIVIAAFVVLIVMCVAIFVWFFTRVRLTVTPEGVTFHSIGMSVSSPWSNVERIDTKLMYGEGNVEGLVLREPGLQASAFLRVGSFLDFGAQMSMKAYEQFIPISSILTNEWRQTEFADELRRYAPHLIGQL